jgi:hypothetical protein
VSTDIGSSKDESGVTHCILSNPSHTNTDPLNDIATIHQEPYFIGKDC